MENMENNESNIEHNAEHKMHAEHKANSAEHILSDAEQRLTKHEHAKHERLEQDRLAHNHDVKEQNTKPRDNNAPRHPPKNRPSAEIGKASDVEKFRELGLQEELLRALSDLGFTAPTEVQQKAIPLVINGSDVIAGSATGSGKTLVFGAGIIHSVTKNKGIQALVLTPTRELAEQIQVALKSFAKYRQMNITAIYGGVSINPQFKALERADVVVGTPGRILDHLERGTIDLSNVKHLILDEADRMLDMGFLDDVKKIMSRCPKEKQTLLFSATISSEISEIAKRFMKSPVKVSAVAMVDPKKMDQVYYDVKTNMKFSLLVHLMKKESTGLVMVFCNSRHYTDTVAKNLNRNKIEAMAIHGGLSQAQRNSTLEKFNSKDTFVLVCTDVAARGLDIPGVSHVYNYDMPLDAKQYIHRIGRTARAGKSGKVINLVCDRDHESFGKILREYDLKIQKLEKPMVEKIELSAGTRGDGTRFGGSGPRGEYGRGPSRDGGSRGGMGRSSFQGRAPARQGEGGGRFEKYTRDDDSSAARYGNQTASSERRERYVSRSSDDKNQSSSGPRRSSGGSRSFAGPRRSGAPRGGRPRR
jgi:superfamily II DNA/RNA helicase